MEKFTRWEKVCGVYDSTLYDRLSSFMTNETFFDTDFNAEVSVKYKLFLRNCIAWSIFLAFFKSVV